jgi:hypothetical protein
MGNSASSDLSSKGQKEFLIQVDINPSYKVRFSETELYIDKIKDNETVFPNFLTIKYKKLLYDEKNPKALLVKDIEDKWIYIGNKIYEIVGDEYTNFTKLVCIPIGDGMFNLPYGYTEKYEGNGFVRFEVIYGFTENLIADTHQLKNEEYDNPFLYFHKKIPKKVERLILNRKIIDESSNYMSGGVSPYKFKEHEVIVIKTGNGKIVIKEYEMEIFQDTKLVKRFNYEEIFIKMDETSYSFLMLLESGKNSYKYKFLSNKDNHSFVVDDKFIKFFNIENTEFYGLTKLELCKDIKNSEQTCFVKTELNPIYFSKYVYNEFIDYFKPKDEWQRFIPNVYYIHDNFGKPFRVTIQKDEKIAIIDKMNYNTDENFNLKNMVWEPLFKFHYLHIYIGENDLKDEDSVKGSSILIHIESGKENKDTYILVWSEILKFTIEKSDTIEFYSRESGNDTFLPYILTRNHIYTLFSGEINKIELNKVKRDSNNNLMIDSISEYEILENPEILKSRL